MSSVLHKNLTPIFRTHQPKSTVLHSDYPSVSSLTPPRTFGAVSKYKIGPRLNSQYTETIQYIVSIRLGDEEVDTFLTTMDKYLNLSEFLYIMYLENLIVDCLSFVHYLTSINNGFVSFQGGGKGV